EQYTYDMDKQWQLRENLLHMLPGEAFQVIEGQAENQLPNIVGICKTGMEGQLVMLKLNEQNFHISTGSACDINSASGTKAILAMGKTITEARQFFRISFGADTQVDEVMLCGEALRKII
ncbi:MAG: aminotransferase class V-fold PLP-dependent enzyme, partial [Solibacillus sp.]